MKDMNGRCPRCGILLTSSYRPYGWVILGLMVASGVAGAAGAALGVLARRF